MSTRAPSFDGMTWMAYVRKHADGDTNTEIGNKVGVSGATVGRWDKSRPDPAQVRAFARSYRRPVLEAFIAAGLLTPEDARERPTAPLSLDELTSDDLIKEVRKRMRECGSSANTDEPREKSPPPADELARRRAWEAIPDDAAAYDTGEPSEYEKQVEQQDRAAERPDESGEE